MLVEAASLAFLFTFAVVCGLAFRQHAGARWITAFGAAAGSAAIVALVIRLVEQDPLSLVSFGALVLVAMVGRPWILRHMDRDAPASETSDKKS
jgi:hypothetical protein